MTRSIAPPTPLMQRVAAAASAVGAADLADPPLPSRRLACVGRMRVGLLVAAIGVRHVAERSAGAARRSA
ncbi:MULTISPECIES: hypothetical protein [Streptomyces]|uniref:hypothetical protein n=1 Tax=Streptomyces TaxID=1883 RepID=UPI0011094CB5|nr:MULTISPECIES: hypothetical protein [Streptomyces]